MFDVFGTVVDWRTGIAREATTFFSQHAPEVDPWVFADAWRAQYGPSMEAVRNGSRPFVPLDVLHRENLETALKDVGVDPSALPHDELDEFNLAWHHLDPWPDVLTGLTRLRSHYILAPLSNANIRLALDMAKRAGIPWDTILGAEVVRAYKPTPESYERTVELLMLQPAEVALVAAHNRDLDGARHAGLRTVFVPRATEHGPGQQNDLTAEQDWNLTACDFIDLADRLTPTHG